LGDGAGEMGASLQVVDLGSGRTATQLALGEEHSCALLDNASVKCWGGNIYGQLGVGDDLDRGNETGEMGNALPVVSFGSATPISIAAGDYHTCALLDSGQVTCWGLNSSGQLGRGTNSSVGAASGFVATTTVSLGTGRTAVALALGSSHTCVVLDDLSIKCFGSGGNGRLGTGATDSRGDAANELGDALPAIALGTARRVWAAAAGGSHTCVLLDDLSVKCFGNGSSGRLGSDGSNSLGDATEEMGDNLLAINLGANVLAIGAGDLHTCAVLVTEVVKCWGNGSDGALGLNDVVNQGDTSGQMAALGIVAVTPSTTTEPGVVRSLAATAGETSVDLSWLVPANTGGVAISDYVIEYRATTSTAWTTVNDGVSTATGVTVSGLSAGTSYEFRVSARNAVHRGITALASATPTTTTTTTTTTVPTPSSSSSSGSSSSGSSAPSPATTTTSVVASPLPVSFVEGPSATVIATTLPSPTMLSSFVPYSAALTTKQKAEIARFARAIPRTHVVHCVVHSNSPVFVSRIMVRRAKTACAEVRRLVRGVQATAVVSNLPTPRQARQLGLNEESLARQVILRLGGVAERRFG
ncbi:MAG: hypothetical protein RLZZ254_648, partial [Actinomycetota bacterium]